MDEFHFSHFSIFWIICGNSVFAFLVFITEWFYFICCSKEEEEEDEEMEGEMEEREEEGEMEEDREDEGEIEQGREDEESRPERPPFEKEIRAEKGTVREAFVEIN